MKTFLGDRVILHPGDCLDVLATFAENSFDSIVTDPPYHFGSGEKRSMKRASPSLVGGFMGMKWDGGDIAFRPSTWAAILRALKPGGHMLAFGAPRNSHRLVCAIEDAGFEIRDSVLWLFGQGFPKSLDVSKAIDKAAGATREVVGVKRAGLARKARDGGDMAGGEESFEHLRRADVTMPATPEAAQWEGWGTALKPAFEPVCVARKPLDGTVVETVLKWGTGALNIDGCRVEAPDGVPHFTKRGEKRGEVYGDGLNGSNRTGEAYLGRWPANVVHDGSPEVLAGFPETTSGSRKAADYQPLGFYANGIQARPDGMQRAMPAIEGDSGSAARFFYTAKADDDDRLGSKHPTIKPIDLMQWLVRLVTPSGGLVLDPFAGTGTTGEAAFREGMRAVLIEADPAYANDIERRMSLVMSGTGERKRATAKAKDRRKGTAPLFDGLDP